MSIINITFIVFGAVIVLLVLLLFIVWAIIRRPTAISSEDDLLDKNGMFMLAKIPRFKTALNIPGSVPSSFKSKGYVPFNVLVRNVLLAVMPQKQLRLLVTSPNYRSGKSFIAVNLAIALAERGDKILLVDAHPQRSGWDSLLPVSSSSKLTTAGAWETGINNLAAYRLRPGTTISGIFWAELVDGFDIVVVDGPPVAKATYLLASNALNNLILVAAPRLTTFEAFDATIPKLREYPINILGYVMNNPQPLNRKKRAKSSRKSKSSRDKNGKAGVDFLRGEVIGLNKALNELRRQHNDSLIQHATDLEKIASLTQQLEQTQVDLVKSQQELKQLKLLVSRQNAIVTVPVNGDHKYDDPAERISVGDEAVEYISLEV